MFYGAIELTYPDNWFHQTWVMWKVFAPVAEAFDEHYQVSKTCHLLVRAEWNGLLQDLQPFGTST
jgi:hypothetical protein